jgi:sugar phosphate isomerase/epimerase
MEVTRRLRISHVVVQPVLVWDDGDELAPGPPAQAVQVSLAELDGYADRLRAEIVGMQPE